MPRILEISPRLRQILNWSIIIGSVLLCLLVLPMRLPGTELLGIRPNWLLVWVVIWSVKRNMLQGAIAGLALGLIQDGMTAFDTTMISDTDPLQEGVKEIGKELFAYPSHIISLTLVGILTARIQKQRYIQEDFISIALIVFAMTIIAETITAIQYCLQGLRDIASVWSDHQRIALSSAILSSLWAPVVYYPLNRWWEYVNELEQSS